MNQVWYLVEVRGYRFHRPGGTKTLEAVAVPAHDGGHLPDQPAREIPDVGLTIEAQRRCVEMTIERLSASAPVACGHSVQVASEVEVP